jgi:hypothetical protein
LEAAPEALSSLFLLSSDIGLMDFMSPEAETAHIPVVWIDCGFTFISKRGTAVKVVWKNVTNLRG